VGVKFGLPPIAPPDCRLFILGSLPGDASLSAGLYYAHPTNQFWRLLGSAIGVELQPLSYDERLARLAERRIGLWDVIGSASRHGSLDQSIREAELNRIDHLLHDFPHLRAIAFNGSAASRSGRMLVGESAGIALVDLPSSSAANTRSFVQKALAWSLIGQFVRP
jgi:hypoxanthine-DNA glycosylase